MHSVENGIGSIIGVIMGVYTRIQINTFKTMLYCFDSWWCSLFK